MTTKKNPENWLATNSILPHDAIERAVGKAVRAHHGAWHDMGEGFRHAYAALLMGDGKPIEALCNGFIPRYARDVAKMVAELSMGECVIEKQRGGKESGLFKISTPQWASTVQDWIGWDDFQLEYVTPVRDEHKGKLPFWALRQRILPAKEQEPLDDEKAIARIAKTLATLLGGEAEEFTPIAKQAVDTARAMGMKQAA